MENPTQITDVSKHQRLIRKLCPYLLLVAISLPALLLRLDVYPPVWFDEGYRTNAARTMLEQGIYGTYTVEGLHPFDPSTTSGPTDIAAIALSFKLLGFGVEQARLAIIPFTLAALLSLYMIAVYIYGRTSGLFIMLMLLAVPAIQNISFLLLGRQVMAEAPSLAMISLGLWSWFRSWETGHWWPNVFAGLLLGLGLLSKTQVGIALLPTLTLIAIARGRRDRLQLIKLFTPIIIMLGILAGWTLTGSIGTPDAIRQEDRTLLLETIQTLLLTGLLGRALTRSAALIFAIMIVGVLASSWRLSCIRQKTQPATNRQWAEATIALFVLCTALWFAFISIGWLRYAYAGWVTGLMLIGKLSWDIFQHVQQWIKRYCPLISRYSYSTVLGGLTIAAIFTNVYPPLHFRGNNAAQRAADYIRTEIPRNAVIESWEWELDALSSHWRFHHPSQRYLLLGDRQLFHERGQFNLNYDLLQADPDYLITGPFSEWTQIYGSTSNLEAHFTLLTEIPPYRVYKRIR